MRKTFVSILFTLAACGGAKANQPATNTGGDEPVKTADTAKPGSSSFPDECCCVVGSDSSMAFDGPSECAEQKGSCTDQWTDECQGEASQQEAADERNAADAECASGDRHDCDGDGARSDEDQDDTDPKVQ
jgi:hypothetical protein